MKKHYPIYAFCMALITLAACSGDKKTEKNTAEKGVEMVLPDMKNEVSVMTLKKQDFHHELVSNGKVTAKEQANLRFESSEVIAHIYVKNAERAEAGRTR